MAIYAKIENGEVTQYPLYEGDLQNLFPQYVYPLDYNQDKNNGLIAPEGYVRIVHTWPKDIDLYSKLVEGKPTLINGEWTQTWERVSFTAEECEQHIVMLAAGIIEQRNALLNRSDKFVMPDRWEKYDEHTKREWADYRQALRDVTDQVNYPKEVEWPIEPSVFIINSF